jgi:hypothetical protein
MSSDAPQKFRGFWHLRAFNMSKEIKIKDRQLVYQKYDYKCAYCGIELSYNEMQVDHIEPRRRGDIHNENVVNGRNHISNYNPSCRSCNASKSTFSIEQWRIQIKKKLICLERDSSNFRICKKFGLLSVSDVEVKFHFENY